MDRLMVECRNCNYRHIPIRLSAKYHDDNVKKQRIQLWECRECGHIWKDSVFK
mgnify:FL=1|jgi:uncharacterized Zn finger protein